MRGEERGEGRLPPPPPLRQRKAQAWPRLCAMPCKSLRALGGAAYGRAGLWGPEAGGSETVGSMSRREIPRGMVSCGGVPRRLPP